MRFRSQFERKKVQVHFPEGEGRTKQSFKKECDVNQIMLKYKKTGLIDHVQKHQGTYGDYLNAPDYQTAMNKVIEAESMFMELPATVRKRFSNDPHEFLSFVGNESNKEEMQELGLIPKPKVHAPPQASEEKKPEKE